MSSRTPTEIRSLITELEEPFIMAPRISGPAASRAEISPVIGSALRDRMRLVENIIFTREDYRAQLSPLLSQRASAGPALLRHYKDMVVSGLRSEIRNHLSPTSELVGAGRDADALEAFEAYALLRLDPEDVIRETIHYYQAAGFFFAAVLEMQDYMPPLQGKGESDADYSARKERHRAQWFPWKIAVKNPESVAFAEHDHRITMASCRYRLPLIDIMKRYAGDQIKGGDDPELMYRVYKEHFGFLRADEPGKADTGLDMWQQDFEVCWLDDGLTINHSINMDGVRGNNTGYELLGEGAFPNPFGSVSLDVCEGVYNPGQPKAYLREPLLMTMVLLQDGLAKLNSHWLSETLSPPMMYEQMPAEADPENAPPEMVFLVDPVTGRPLIPRSYGEIKVIEHKLDETRDKLYSNLQHDANVASPMSLLNYDEAKSAQVPVTNVLTQIDEWKSRLGGAAKSETSWWGRQLDRIEYSMRNKLNAHRGKGDAKSELDWPYSFITTGQEKVKGKHVTQGKSYEITPQILDGEYTRTLEPVDTRLSTRAAMQAEADKRWAAGSLLYDEWLEMHGVENVTDFKTKKKAEILYQMEAPGQIMKVRQAMAELEALRSGKSVEEILTLTSVNPDFASQLAAMPPPTAAAGITRMGSPQLEGMGTGVESQSVV